MRERTQPDLRAEIELLHAVYPRDHPYYRTGIGDARSLRRIDRGALQRFHRDHFVAQGASVAVTGSVPMNELRRAVEAGFLGESTRPAPAPPPIPSVGVPRHPRRSVTMPGRAQVELRVGLPGIRRDDPRFPALFLANEVLGGQVLLSRLFQKVREQEGLAYHASSDLEAMGWGGVWEAQAGTGPERVDAVERMVLTEMDRLAREPIPVDELARIRESSLGSTALEIETTQGAHDLAVTAAYYHLPDDYYLRWATTLRAVRPEEIRAAAAELMRPELRSVVVVGPPDAPPAAGPG